MLIPSFLFIIFLIPSAGFLIVSADSLIALENILIGIMPIPRETSFFLILLIFFYSALSSTERLRAGFRAILGAVE